VFLGRVVRAGDPLWLEDDRAWAMALLEVDSDLHRPCGHPLSETTAVDPATKLPVHTYEVDLPDLCGACAVLNAELDDPAWEQQSNARAHVFTVIKKT
jgi:hypothetical protein